MWEMVPRLQNSVKSEKMTVDVWIFSMLWQILSLLRPAKKHNKSISSLPSLLKAEQGLGREGHPGASFCIIPLWASR